MVPTPNGRDQKNPITENETEDANIIRRNIQPWKGVYLEGRVSGVEVTFTADTGATRTVISDSVYHQIPSEQRPKLKKSSCLAGANGKPLTELGKGLFNIQLGGV